MSSPASNDPNVPIIHSEYFEVINDKILKFYTDNGTIYLPITNIAYVKHVPSEDKSVDAITLFQTTAGSCVRVDDALQRHCKKYIECIIGRVYNDEDKCII